MKKWLFLSLLLALAACGNLKQKTTETADDYAQLDSLARIWFGALPLVAENPENPLTDEKIQLGKRLYFETSLSRDNTQSCNTCHNLNTFGVDNNPTSAGNDGELGGRNSPTTFNAALHIAQFWDGREHDVEAQAGGPILNPIEMGMPSEEIVIQRLSSLPEYPALFRAAFPQSADPINYDNVKKAIGAFERKLITPSRFDDYINGDDQALTTEEKNGLKIFIETGCTTCHAGNLLGGRMYQKFGLFGDYAELTKSETVDKGKFDVTKNDPDLFVFKVPSLRNIEKTAPYFHDGSVRDLLESIHIMAKLQLNKELSEQDASDIVTFLKSLTADIPEELKKL